MFWLLATQREFSQYNPVINIIIYFIHIINIDLRARKGNISQETSGKLLSICCEI